VHWAKTDHSLSAKWLLFSPKVKVKIRQFLGTTGNRAVAASRVYM